MVETCCASKEATWKQKSWKTKISSLFSHLPNRLKTEEKENIYRLTNLNSICKVFAIKQLAFHDKFYLSTVSVFLLTTSTKAVLSIRGSFRFLGAIGSALESRHASNH